MSDQPPSSSEIASLIKKKARNLGFDDCRICSAAPPDEVQVGAFRDWLTQGMAGTMGWFERSAKAREDIRSRYPWARSVIVLRMYYPANLPDAPKSAIANRIARYAQTSDYHDHYAEVLKKLQNYCSRFDDGMDAADYGDKAPPAKGGCQALWYQDTGPVLEHAYAERAGIGWTGKHTLTLHAEHGSYFFLAEIITSLELPADEASTRHCGKCTACIDACPTDAIIEPYKLDARRCISYLTIEHKGRIDDDLRGELNGWLFGCDICQEVCPYNKKREERDGPRPPGDRQHQPLLELSLLDVLLTRDPRLEEMLEGTPLHRTGAARLKRNAALIAGAEQDATLLKGITHCITHPEEFVRSACIWALRQYAGTGTAAQARQALVTHQKRETDEALRDELVDALIAMEG